MNRAEVPDALQDARRKDADRYIAWFSARMQPLRDARREALLARVWLSARERLENLERAALWHGEV